MRYSLLNILAGIASLLVLLPPSTAEAKDISGYFTPDNSWTLHSRMNGVILDGFAEVPAIFTGITYMDLSRTIQFSGEDVKVAVTLFELDDRLAGFSFYVPSSERTFSFLKRYYSGRYPESMKVLNESDSISWVDDEFDSITVMYFDKPDSESYSIVLYMTESLFDEATGYQIPDWIKELSKTIEEDYA